MPQALGLQVLFATVGVNQGAVCGQRHGIDGEVSPGEIFFQCNGGVSVDLKAVVAVPRLPLGTGEGVFLLGVRVQKDGEIPTDLPITLGQHILGGCSHHHPVGLGVGIAQQLVPNGTANLKYLEIICDYRLPQKVSDSEDSSNQLASEGSEVYPVYSRHMSCSDA